MRFFNIKNINELVNTSKINEYLFDHAHYTKIDFSYLVELIDTCESIFKSIVLFV